MCVQLNIGAAVNILSRCANKNNEELWKCSNNVLQEKRLKWYSGKDTLTLIGEAVMVLIEKVLLVL